MTLLIQKFGGTSVGSPERILAMARKIRAVHDGGVKSVVVVSAMGGETDRLAALCAESGGDDPREMDAILSSGEQVSAGVMALALQSIGVAAKSYDGAAAGIFTDGQHGRARITQVDPAPLREALARGITPVVTGFQGRDLDNGRATLGRGGSDTTAVALAAALEADECRIYTDVDGVFTADPRVCENARRLDEITFEEMLELASLGAKVLQIRAVECAGNNRVPLRVLSSLDENSRGTLITYEEENMEKPVVTGVAFSRAEAKITMVGVPDQPGVAHGILAAVAEAGVNVDMIVQNIGSDGRTDFSFTVDRADFSRAMACAQKAAVSVGARDCLGEEGLAKISVVGIGMKSHAGVACEMFRVLAEERINIQMVSTSEIKISVAIDEKYLEVAARALHDAFGLQQPPEGGTTPETGKKSPPAP